MSKICHILFHTPSIERLGKLSRVFHRIGNLGTMNTKEDLPVIDSANTIFPHENRHYFPKMQKYLENIAACMPGNFFWKDKNGYYLGCNALFLETLNVKSVSDIIGRTDHDLWPQQAELLRAHDKMVMDSGLPLTLEEEVITPEGRHMYFAGIKTPLRDEKGAIIGVIGNSLDITKQKDLEQQLRLAKECAEAADLKNAFIQNMQHDMRTPLTGLIDFFTMMRQANDKDEILRLLSLGENVAKELLYVCDKVVDFGNIYYTQKPIIEKKLSIKGIIEQICDLNLAAIKGKNLELTYEIDENIPVVVKGDDFRLHKILSHLLGNSIKFTNEGELKITVQLIASSNNKVIIEFGIHDTGIGIPEDKRELIFQKFVRLSPSSQGTYKGSGLGLSIVKKCVEELEGEIDIESELGKGTSFYVTLSFERALGKRFAGKAYFSEQE